MSLLKTVETLFEGVKSQDDVCNLPKEEVKRVEKLVLRRAAEIARLKGGHEHEFQGGSSEGENQAALLGMWAKANYPKDATAISWWDSFVWDEMDASDFENFTPSPCYDSATWGVIVSEGAYHYLGPDIPEVDMDLMNAAFALLEDMTKSKSKRKRDDRETANTEAKRSTVPADLAVDRYEPKDMTQPAFHLEPVPEEDLDVNVHDSVAFKAARLKWVGGSAAPKLCGNPWNDPNDIIAQMRGEMMKLAVTLEGWRNMCMGHSNEPVALAVFESLGCTLTDSRFCPIPNTMMVITPDAILHAEDAGDRLIEYFQPPYSDVQPVEVKCHVAGIKSPEPKQRRSDGVTYYPHEATFIQAYLQWLAVNNTNKPQDGVVPSFFLVDHYPAGNETQVWHVAFPDTLFGTMLMTHLEKCRIALLAKKPQHIHKLKLPLDTVVYTRVL